MRQNNINRKAQLKMAENIGILVIFFILLVVGLVFYMRVQKEDVKIEASAKVSSDALVTAQRIASLPEIQCSEPVESESGKQDCIDIYKLYGFSNLKLDILEDFNSYYFDIFRYSNVTVREIYPSQNEWNIYYNRPATYSGSIPVPMPILLYDEMSSRPYKFGILVVEVYR